MKKTALFGGIVQIFSLLFAKKLVLVEGQRMKVIKLIWFQKGGVAARIHNLCVWFFPFRFFSPSSAFTSSFELCVLALLLE